MNLPIDINNYTTFSISVDEDRYKQQCYVFSKYKLNKPIYVPSIKLEHHTFACWYGHSLAVLFANYLNLQYAIVFEDDAYPCDDILNQFNNVIHEINQFNCEFDILSLGVAGATYNCDGMLNNDKDIYLYTKNKIHIINKNILINDFNRIWGSHAYLVNIQRVKHIYRISQFSSCPVDIAHCNRQLLKNYLTKQCLFCQYDYRKLAACRFYNDDLIQVGPMKYCQCNNINLKGFRHIELDESYKNIDINYFNFKCPVLFLSRNCNFKQKKGLT